MNDPATVLNEFYNVCMRVRLLFENYKNFFEDHRTREICWNVAPFFFHDALQAMADMCRLGICKITDPAGKGTRMNLTTNYLLEKLPWPVDLRAQLAAYNERIMTFRRTIEPARSKRIAHVDFDMQVEQPTTLGDFPKGEDVQFFNDLEAFFSLAYGHVHNGDVKPMRAYSGLDTHQLVQAIQKSKLYDRCQRCTESQRTEDVLNVEAET